MKGQSMVGFYQFNHMSTQFGKLRSVNLRSTFGLSTKIKLEVKMGQLMVDLYQLNDISTELDRLVPLI